MYLALWHVLPGPLWLRILFALLLLLGALYALATWVFPWVDTLVNNQEATVGSP